MNKLFKINFVVDNGCTKEKDTAFVSARNKVDAFDKLSRYIHSLDNEYCLEDIDIKEYNADIFCFNFKANK